MEDKIKEIKTFVDFLMETYVEELEDIDKKMLSVLMKEGVVLGNEDVQNNVIRNKDISEDAQDELLELAMRTNYLSGAFETAEAVIKLIDKDLFLCR